MTIEQQRKVKVLESCRFLPGSFAKRFTRSLGDMIALDPEIPLTTRQAETLDSVFHQYRKQHNACHCPECHDPTQQTMFGGAA